MRTDLQPLVIEPREDLAMEYKAWLNIAKEEDKAVLAKACIALANHGGGFLIMGFDEHEGSLTSSQRPAEFKDITQDAINSIIQRYAEPSFHCQLHTIAHPETRVEHLIVTVPADISVPVISQRDCGGVIRQHSCYIRKSGPRSEAPRTEAEWRTLLHRCVQANRVDMLSAIRSIVLGRTETENTETQLVQEIEDFRNSSFERWQTLTEKLEAGDPEKFPNGYYEVAIHPNRNVPAATLNELQQRLTNARRIKLSGWTPFLEMGAEEWRPVPISDRIEAWIGRKTKYNTPREPYSADYWCATKRGQLYTIRGYTEDSLLKDPRNVQPGAVFYVTLPVIRIGEILYFASRFFDEFTDIKNILVKCKFTGLLGRTLSSIDLSYWSYSRTCHSPEFENLVDVTTQQLKENVEEIVHEMLTPLYEAFDFYELSREMVERELGKLKKNRF